jgi:hypothetical protein
MMEDECAPEIRQRQFCIASRFLGAVKPLAACIGVGLAELARRGVRQQ